MPTGSSAGQHASVAEEARGKISRRILPYVFFIYILSYIDRANVAFANRPKLAGTAGL